MTTVKRAKEFSLLVIADALAQAADVDSARLSLSAVVGAFLDV
jgi:hypothetical protein